MRNPLNKRLIRDLKHNAGRYIAVAVIMIASVAMLSGFLSTADGIKEAFENNRVNCKVENGLFTSYFKIPKETITKTEKLGANIYENYYSNEPILKSTKLRIYESKKDIDIPTVIEGRLPEGKYEIALDRLFARNNSLKVGDKLKIKGKYYKITGTISLPNYSSLFEKNSNLMMETKYFGIAVVSKEDFKNFNDSNLVYNYSYYFKNRNLNERKSKDLSNKIEKSLVKNGAGLTDFCTAANNQSISFVQEDMGSDVPSMKVFCYITIAIMAFVFAIIVMSTIDEESQIIGTLLSNGYSKREILGHYMRMPIFVTIISAVIGNIIGYFVLPPTFKAMYYNSYSLPPCTIKLNSEALMLTTIIPICIMIFINISVISLKLKASPLQFLKKDLKKHSNGKPVKLPPFKFVKRFRLRVILQNKANYFMLFIGIFLGSVILLFGLAMMPIINHYVEDIQNTSVSNYQYILKAPEVVRKNSAESFTVYSLKTYYKAGNRNLDVSFYGISSKSKYLKNLSLSDKEKGIYMSDGVMKKLGNKVGDRVKFLDPYTNDTYYLKVIGSIHYSSGFAVFMNNKQLNRLLKYDESYYNGYFSNKKLNISSKNLASVITSKDMVKLGQQMTSSVGSSANMCIIAAILIYIALMYILTKIVIDKNSLYISYMKVFGYEAKEIRSLYLNATTIVVILSLILGLPLDYLALKYCFSFALNKVNGYMEIWIPSYLFVAIVAVGIVTYLVINLLHVKRINKISMAEALKNRE
ncbi:MULTISPECIES: ABC transporter permease [Clostridium]|uniref:ABC transporter permease n=1 Tax=Clostridium TaxID=1485 RepID=UPI000824CE75|nr:MULTISPECIES: FtsX-like permease family protein [Clostridium]PJI07729.1 ABC transporter permease [Clostridium sp. CT7]